jgi:hypothetical protein
LAVCRWASDFRYRPKPVLAKPGGLSGQLGAGEHHSLCAVCDPAGAVAAVNPVFAREYHWADCGIGPLSVAAIAFYARLVDSALREVDKGIIEAAEAFGASPMRIICTVLLKRVRIAAD